MKVPNIETMSYNHRDNGRLLNIAAQLVAAKQNGKMEVIKEAFTHFQDPKMRSVERKYPNANLYIERTSTTTYSIHGSWIQNGELKSAHLNVTRRTVEAALGMFENADFDFTAPAEKEAKPAKAAAKKLVANK